MTNQSPQYRDYTMEIPAFGTAQIDSNGEFITCLKATLPFKISFDDQPRTNFAEGLSYDAQVPFKRVRLDNENDTPISVNIGIGRGGIKDTRFVATGSILTKTVAPPLMVNLPMVTILPNQTMQIVDDDVRRKEVIIRHTGGDPSPVWLRSDSFLQAGGMLVNEGEGLTLNTSSEVWAYNPSAFPVVIGGLEIREAL